MSQRWCKKFFFAVRDKEDNCREQLAWHGLTDSSQIAQTRLRIRLEEGCSLALVETTKTKASTNSAVYVEHWAGGQRETCFEREKVQLPPYVVRQRFAKRCRSLESIQPMRSPVRFRQTSPYPLKSIVMAQALGSVTSWRTEGQDQMLLLAAWRGNNKCQDNEVEDCPYLVAESTECLQCDDHYMSRRRLTRYSRWSV